MEFAALASFLTLGFGLGVVHAFDPDHIAAVGGLTAGQNSEHKTWRFALHWSFGHGSALLIIAILVFLLGAAIPEGLSHYAERSVAFMLIVIGGFGLYRIYVGHKHEKPRGGLSSRFGAPVVGLIHGTAGSAPLLALIPLSQLAQPAVGFCYVLFFSAGVMLAMTSIGSLLSLSLRFLVRQYASAIGFFQSALACFSIILGAYLVLIG